MTMPSQQFVAIVLSDSYVPLDLRPLPSFDQNNPRSMGVMLQADCNFHQGFDLVIALLLD